MNGVLIALMIAAVMAGLLHPIFAGPRRGKATAFEAPDSERTSGYLSPEELEFDYRSGKLDKSTYEQLAQEQAGAETLDADIELEIRRQRARRAAGTQTRPTARRPEVRNARGGSRPRPAVRCGKCGTVGEDDDSFCARCGSPLAARPGLACPSCRNAVEPDDEFCAACGASIR